MSNTFLPVCSPMLDGNEQVYLAEAASSGWISSSGKYVAAFEEAFAAYCGARHGIAVCNGTVALHLALTALGIGKGDEVIIPSFTMAASAFAVCYTGAMPVFADADPHTWNIDPNAVKALIGPRTRVIMPVHIFGNPCAMDSLRALAANTGVALLEDAAEAHGASYKGQKTGNLGNLAAFSFFANKNISTGEGGMVVTNDEHLARQCRYYKNLCFPLNAPRTYIHGHIGFNYRMSNLHAAIGLAQTEKADHYKALRIRNGKYYRQRLSAVPGIALQTEQANAETVFWMNGIVVDPAVYGAEREELMEHLATQGIETRRFFSGMHAQPALQNYGCACDGPFPVTDWLAANGLYLPSGSNLALQDIDRVCDCIKNYARRR